MEKKSKTQGLCKGEAYGQPCSRTTLPGFASPQLKVVNKLSENIRPEAMTFSCFKERCGHFSPGARVLMQGCQTYTLQS